MAARVVENYKTGERITVLKTAQETGGDFMEFEVYVPAGFQAVPMHKHPRQREHNTVVSGRVGAMIGGHPCAFIPGDTMVIPAGSPHRWWNAGDEPLTMITRIAPSLRFLDFLESLYKSANARQSDQPSLFDGVYLLQKYWDEYRLLEIPQPVQKLVFPVVRIAGYLLGQYRKYE